MHDERYDGGASAKTSLQSGTDRRAEELYKPIISCPDPGFGLCGRFPFASSVCFHSLTRAPKTPGDTRDSGLDGIVWGQSLLHSPGQWEQAQIVWNRNRPVTPRCARMRL